jgi:hypothetical protein
MKSRLILLFSTLLIFLGCSKESENFQTLQKIEGLSMYWDHEVFGEEGRRIRFEFFGKQKFENSYDLVFNYTIIRKTITIQLISAINNGKCQNIDKGFNYEMDSLCTPSGRLFIPDKLLSKGTYSLTIKAPSFEITSELIVGDDSISLDIPSNTNFSSSFHAIYPIPENLLFGYVVYAGAENIESANNFISDLKTLGLTETKVPDFPYRNLSVDANGNIINTSWPPDNYSQGFIYTLHNNFKDIVNLAKEHFNKTNLNIYLFSSEGDEARFNKIDGIIVVYHK